MAKSQKAIYKFSYLKIVLIFLILIVFIFILRRIKTNNPNYNNQSTLPTLTSYKSPVTKEIVKVAYVLDGDTIVLLDKRRVRYLGIDAPEYHPQKKIFECFGENSTLANQNLVKNNLIELEKDISDTDKYGRLLRYAYINGEMINTLLLQQGYATLELIPPDLKYQDQFKQSQNEAKLGKLGVWSSCLK